MSLIAKVLRYDLVLPTAPDASSREVWIREQIGVLVPLVSLMGPTIRLVRHPHPHAGGRAIAYFFFDFATQYLLAVPVGRWFYGRVWDKELKQ
jgi:hypothetical protein